MKAEVLTIGDELLRGEIVDSNKSFLSDRLLGLDIETRFHATVADDPADMADAYRRAAERSDIVLVSGGLGPTRDDLTMEVLAKTFGLEMVLHEETLENLRAFFANFGREMAANNEKQAWFPDGAEVLPNPIGTAPGCMLRVPAQQAGAPGAGGAAFFCMPGVPRELMLMMDEQVMPRVGALGGDQVVVRATLLRTFGVGESNLDNDLSDVAADGDVVLGFRTSFPENYLRPVARAATAEEAEAKLAKVCDTIRARLGPLIYGDGDDTLESVVGRLLDESGQTVAVAESCSGGMLAERLTSVPGASRYFRGGVVAYANSAKAALLGVDEGLLEREGAVSEPVALAMAQGVRERFGTDFGVATTGIAGPTGGSEDKPVGTVWIALAHGDRAQARCMIFPFDRERHRQITSAAALDWVRRTLLGAEMLEMRFGRRK